MRTKLGGIYHRAWKGVFTAWTLGWLAYQLYLERKQYRNSGESLRKHFESFWNKNDAIWLALTPTFIICSLIGVSTSTLTIIGAFSCFSLSLKAFDWMRLFDCTAFYILLLTETIEDVKVFMIVFVMSFMMFGVPIFVLSYNTEG